MPRVSREQADKHRAAIEEAAARLFREQGLHGVSVADLMAAAGLTHGGFYGHFESKDALAAAACDHAFAQSAERWRASLTGPDAELAWRRIIGNYLDGKTREHAGTCCPAATLASDVGREPEDKPVRGSYVTGIKHLLEALAVFYDRGDPEAARKQALVDMSTLVGAQILARATRSDPLSDDILAAVREALLATDH
jgi:TetR/AcrR family transcriptional repressor of nem operon